MINTSLFGLIAGVVLIFLAPDIFREMFVTQQGTTGAPLESAMIGVMEFLRWPLLGMAILCGLLHIAHSVFWTYAEPSVNRIVAQQERQAAAQQPAQGISPTPPVVVADESLPAVALPPQRYVRHQIGVQGGTQTEC